MNTVYNDDKPPNYRQNANFISAFTFWWTHNIFNLGKKRDLYESDLPEALAEDEASKLGDKIAALWSKEYKWAKTRQTTPSLARVLIKCFLGEYARLGTALILIEMCFKPMQPLFVGLLVRYFTTENHNNNNTLQFPMYFSRIFYYNYPNQSPIQADEAYIYATSVVLCSLISVSVQHPYMLSVMHLGMKIRVACTTLMYRKTLRMSLLALSPITVGNVVNLMTNDATRFDLVMMFLHYLWLCPIQFVFFIYIMYHFVNFSAFIGACVILIFIPIQLILAHYNKRLRWKTAYKTDERVRLMNEIIAGVQVIKMYAWEYAFCRLINKSRRQEMRLLVQTSYIRGIVMSMIMFTSRLATFITLIAFTVLFNNKIDSETVFIILGYWIIMRSSMTLFFPQGVTQFAETLITIKRTQDYMLNEEAIVGNPAILDPSLKTEEDDAEIELDDESELSASEMQNPSFTPSIRLIEVYARWQKRYVVRNVEFSVNTGELVGLIGQIGAGKSSLLHVLLSELPVVTGYVSVKGVVSYASQEPWLFQGSVRQNILFGHAYNKDRYRKVCKVCALLNDFKLLPYGDQTVVGERGISLSGGQRARINLARCIYKQADIYLLDDPLSAVDAHVGAQIFEQCITKFLTGKIRILVTHQLQFLNNVDQLLIMDKGKILAYGSYLDLVSSGLDFGQYLHVTKIGDIIKSKEPEVDEKEKDAGFVDVIHHRESLTETRAVGTVQCEFYKKYIRSGGNCCHITFLVFLFVIAQIFASASDYFIGQWVKIEELKSNSGNAGFGIVTDIDAKECIVIYSIITELLIISSIARSFYFFYICLRASIKLHDDMFESIVFGHMKFFNTNPSGRILNRFSKDMGAVDEDLPYAMIDFFQMLLSLVGVVIILTLTNYFLLIPIIIIVILIYFLRQFYLKTSRSLKRIEGVVRSYVFAHLNASIQGLSTIRSHGAEEILTYEFDKHQDLHSSAWYLFIATARAFSVWTDLLCIMFMIISAYGFLLLFHVFNLNIMAGDVGLCITQCMTLTGLIPWGMRQSAEMENHMTSVERIIEYTKIEHEPPLISSLGKRPPLHWPQKGEITFQDLEVRYSLQEAPVLHNINIRIEPEEKIGIVGRTGAGKSSMIASLFRLGYQSGSIVIDGVNIFEIGLHDLRRKIAIIPQEPIIFTGTLRFNLDPFHEYADETLLAALSIVDLERGKRNILYQSLSEGGASISSGQKQLLCLARAIVRNNKILIMDEATANIDPITDRLIQNTIRKAFKHSTVLTIAHRLHTVMDSDRIIVMHAGTVIEFDHPYILLQNSESYFSKMVEKTGSGEYLKEIAQDNYKNRKTSEDSQEEEI